MTEIRVEHYRGYRIVAYEQEREFLIAVYASTNFVLKAISVPKSAGIAGAFAAAREFINKEWEKGGKRNQLSLGSRKRMSGLAMVPRSSVMTPMSTTCSDFGRS